MEWEESVPPGLWVVVLQVCEGSMDGYWWLLRITVYGVEFL